MRSFFSILSVQMTSKPLVQGRFFNNFNKLEIKWRVQRDSNSQPTDLESAALPLELCTHLCLACFYSQKIFKEQKDYSTISETVPAPMVRPPSLTANFKPFSIAMGVISSTSKEVLSPGITISVPLGRVIEPVTSVVLK